MHNVVWGCGEILPINAISVEKKRTNLTKSYELALLYGEVKSQQLLHSDYIRKLLRTNVYIQ